MVSIIIDTSGLGDNLNAAVAELLINLATTFEDKQPLDSSRRMPDGMIRIANSDGQFVGHCRSTLA